MKMKNKLLLLGASLFAAFSLTGCMDMTTRAVINPDLSGTYSVITAYDEEYMNSMGDEMEDEGMTGMLTPETPVQNEDGSVDTAISYERDGAKYVGTEKTYHFAHIRDLAAVLNQSADQAYALIDDSSTPKGNCTIEETKVDGGTLYHFALLLNTTNPNAKALENSNYTPEQQAEAQAASKEMLSGMNFTYELTLPGTIVSSNAMASNGNTLAWDLMQMSTDGQPTHLIEASFLLPDDAAAQTAAN